MKERPILFSGPMVRAIRADIKTQTRRTVNKWHFAKGYEGLNLSFSGLVASEVSPGLWRLSSRGEGACWDERAAAICPHGKPGDRLWVREAWKSSKTLDKLSGKAIGEKCLGAGYSKPWAPLTFLADGRVINGDVMRPGTGEFGTKFGRYRHARFMPRWASRITVEITDVRVERLLSISHDDAIAEGLTRLSKDGGKTFKYGIPDRDGWPGTDDGGWAWDKWDVDPRKAYFRLWDKINGAGASQANPWVWAEAFRRLEVR